MNNQWINKLNQVIVERNLLVPKQKILIAVSGGQDSMMLFSVLYRLYLKWQWRLGVIHCDHKWHLGSKEHAKSIYKLINRLKLPFFLATPVHRISNEETARNWRYSLIYRIAASHKYDVITVGHTSSDRAETLLLNCFRGTSFDGIKSLKWKRAITPRFVITLYFWNQKYLKTHVRLLVSIYYKWRYQKIQIISSYYNIELVRPLLTITRAQIKIQIIRWEVPICVDKTNELITIRRNRIRHQLIPYLKKYFNPKIEHALNALAEIADLDILYLNSIVDSYYKNIRIHQESSVSLELEHFYALPINIQRRLLKKFISSYTHTHLSLSFRQVEYMRLQILNMIDLNLNEKSQSQIIMYLPKTIQVKIQENRLIIEQL